MSAQKSISSEDKMRKASYACDQWGGIHKKTLWEWMKAGKVNPITINGRNYFLDSEIERVKRGDAA